MDEVMEEAERAEKGSEAGTSTGEDVVAEEGVGSDTDIVEEDDIMAGKNSDVTVIVEGETPGKCVEGETPDVVTEGETPVVDTEEEAPVTGTEGETPVVDDEREAPEKLVEGKLPVETEEPDSGGLQTIVDLVDEPKSEEISMAERLTRRRTRQRSMLDEVDEPTRPRELDFGGRRAGAEAEGDVPETTEAEEKHLAAERKRKGKQEVQILPKKPKKTRAIEPTEKQTPKAIKVPFAK